MRRAGISWTWLGVGLGGALLGAAGAGADSIDRYDPESAARLVRECAEEGIDRRVCACALDQLVNDHERIVVPAVSSAPPGAPAAEPASPEPFDGYVAMCTRSALALGLVAD